MAATGLHISISAEPLFAIGGLQFTNSMITSLVVSALLIGFALAVKAQLKTTNRPSGLQNFAEWIIEALHNLVYSITGDLKKTRLFFPVIATFFLFILLNNWLGLVPGVGTIRLLTEEAGSPEETHLEEEAFSLVESVNAAETSSQTSAESAEGSEVVAAEASQEAAAETETHLKAVPLFRPGTADLNTTLALSLFSVILTQLIGFHYLKFSYFKKFINFSSPIMFFVGLLELISEFAKIISFAFRLFGNVFAGEVLLSVTAFLVPLVVPMPFYGLELFVGFIQALVFSMLSLVFFNMATHSHDEH